MRKSDITIARNDLFADEGYREDDEVIRLISARKADTAEKIQYGG